MRNLFLAIILFLVAQLSANAQCKARFALKQLNDSTVQVWDSSVAENAYYSYFHFGDGDTSRTADGKHIYGWSGRYIVCLHIYDLTTGCKHDTCFPGLIKGRRYNVILAEFTYEASQHTVSFTDLSRGSNTIPHTSHWDFGDSTTSNEKNPLHTYTKPGTYTVCLEVEDTIRHMTDKWCEKITIEDPSGVGKNTHEQFIQIYPNPARENLSMRLVASRGPVAISIYDMTGQLLRIQEIGNTAGEFNLDIAQLKPGLYQLKIIAGTQVMQAKFLKL